MLRLSATAIKDLFACDKMYYYRVHHPEAAILSDDIIFGQLIHKAIEEIDNLSEAKEYVTKLWTDKTKTDFLGSPKKYPKSIDRLLNGYYKKILPLLGPKENALVEHTFSVHWKDNIDVIGKWDRVDGESIFDWKTGIVAPNKYVYNDIQFHIYGWVYNKIFKEMPKNVYYGHLYTGTLYNINMTDATLANVELLLDRATKMVYNGSEARDTGYHCGRCLYRGICWEEFGNEFVDC
jgi:CRISPR/Cas system-associated exonuclease Cas4 (RecB family)